MERDNLPGLSVLWLISLAMVLGVGVVVMIPVSIANGDAIKSSDWIGFAGAVTAGTMTIIGAIIAWSAVQQQIRSQERGAESVRVEAEAAKVRAQTDAKEVARVILTPPVHAATAVLYGAQIAIAANNPSAIADWDHVVKQACAQLDTALSHFSLREISSSLNVDDRAAYLITIARLSTLVNIHSKPFERLPRRPSLEIMVQQLNDTEQFLRLFDVELADIFVRDSSLPMGN